MPLLAKPFAECCTFAVGNSPQLGFLDVHQAEIFHVCELICITGRTSTEPPMSRIGQPDAICAARCRSGASMMENPPRTSLDSTYGPSVTVLLLGPTTLPEDRSKGWPRSFN